MFVGGFTLEAAQHVGADEGDQRTAAAEVLDRLARLVDASLVVGETRPNGAVRFRLLETLRLETLRQYGQELLAAGGAAAASAARDRSA